MQPWLTSAGNEEAACACETILIQTSAHIAAHVVIDIGGVRKNDEESCGRFYDSTKTVAALLWRFWC